MEKYLDKNSITSVERYEKKLVCEINKVYKKPLKLFWLLPITKGKYVYQRNSNKFNRFDDYFPNFEDAVWYYCYNRSKYEIDGEKIYLKAHVVVTDNNGTEYFKSFNSEKEVDSYIESLGINIQKNYITIKTD